MQARNRIAYIPENKDTLRNALSVSENIMPITPEKLLILSIALASQKN